MKKLPIFILSAVALAGCSKTEGWSLDGYAPDGIDKVYLQAPARTGSWYDLDTAIVKDGKFTFSLPEANGTIYRLKIGDQSIYLPADSTESLSVSAGGVRSGSTEALLFNTVDSLRGNSRELLRNLDGNYATMAAYYATRINKDYRLLRTVANRFYEEKPDDPRTAKLMSELKGYRSDSTQTAEQTVIFAEEIGYYDVNLMNRNGDMQRLSDIVETTPLVILAYVDFSTESAAAITRILGDARSDGAEIFEVGFADNQHLWANASEGLPWVNVYQSEAADHTHMHQYAITSLPTFFIIKNGEIVERVEDYTTLAEIIRNHK